MKILENHSNVEKSLCPFLRDLVSAIISKFGNEIVSVVLFGSATTKEWVRGKSDIDLIVVVKHHNQRKTIENYMGKVFVRLDAKYGLQLVQTCTTYAKDANPIVNFLYRVEDSLVFGRPFYVLSMDQIDIEKGIITDVRIRFITSIFDSQSIFLAKIKQTGVVIYGRDLPSEIKLLPSALDKIRTALAPLWLIIMSLMSFPIDKLFSLNHSIKATIWACEDVLFTLNGPLSTTTEELDTLEKLVSKYRKMDFSHAKESITLKQKVIRKSDLNGGQVGKFVLHTVLFILTLYYNASHIAHAS